MSPGYERVVMEDYQRKKSHNVLSYQLADPTPARIRSECVRLCKKGLQKKDEKVIRDFCEEWDNARTCLQIINRCGVDKFKPLSNFLKGGAGSTGYKNIELLAWLIDFPDRPYDYTKKYVSPTESEPIIKEPEPSQLAIVEALPVLEDPPTIATEVKNTDREDQKGAERSDSGTDKKSDIESTEDVIHDVQSHIGTGRKKSRFRKAAIVGVLLAVTGTSGYLLRNSPPSDGGCMYWAKDHFQPIPCNQPIPNTLVIALDTARVKHFKKITRPDTITNRAKGGVWYSKIDNEIEFFTTGGEHPVINSRHLKPITDYIIDKYIHPDTTSDR